MPYLILADLVALLHFAFILFVVIGGLAAWKCHRLAWLHVPALLWAALVEFTGWLCPLTPLETSLRIAAGVEAYNTGFFDFYLRPLIYPAALTRSAQVFLGILLLGANIPVYAVMWARWARARSD